MSQTPSAASVRSPLTPPDAFVPPARLLLGPGPSEIAPSVLRALSQPTLGHLDPRLAQAMDESRSMLRALFGAAYDATFAVSGTGTAGMEAVLANLIEPGDGVLVPIHGYFGARVAEIAERCGARVTRVEGEWGRASDVERARTAAKGANVRMIALVHSETSTGVLQDLAPWNALARELGALLCADTVTSLGCVPIDGFANGVDGAWSCSQKGLSCPPGMAPVTFSPRAVERVRARKHKVQSFYLDLSLLLDFWGPPRGYHHTISSNLVYALHEAARLALVEGLDARFERHRMISRAFVSGLEAMGLELLVPQTERLPQLLAVRIPHGVDDARVRGRLLEEFGIEIGGGLGAFKGKLWRIGLMGQAASRRNVVTALGALRATLAGEGWRAKADPIEAAQAAFAG